MERDRIFARNDVFWHPLQIGGDRCSIFGPRFRANHFLCTRLSVGVSTAFLSFYTHTHTHTRAPLPRERLYHFLSLFLSNLGENTNTRIMNYFRTHLLLSILLHTSILTAVGKVCLVFKLRRRRYPRRAPFLLCDYENKTQEEMHQGIYNKRHLTYISRSRV